MSSLEEIKRRKLEDMMRMQQEKLQQQSSEQFQMQQQIAQMEEIVKQFFSKDALARYGNLKTAHSEKAIQLLLILFQAVQKGQIKGIIDDAMLKKLLSQMEPKKREIKINRV